MQRVFGCSKYVCVCVCIEAMKYVMKDNWYESLEKIYTIRYNNN